MALRAAGHPVHPMLVHFPIVLWTGAGASDLVSLWAPGGRFGLVAGDVSFVCLAAGLGMAALAMIAGFFDYASIPAEDRAQSTAVGHMLAMCTAWLILLVSLALRGFPPDPAPSLWAIVTCLAGWLAMAAGGYLGGQLVYVHGIGVRRPVENSGE